MKGLFVIGPILTGLAAVTAHAACTPVTASRILAGDLAHADARYAALPAGLTVAFAPPPGGRRVFTAAELTRLARANGVAIESASDLCFEFPVHAITRDEVIAAIQHSLPANASVGILGLSTAEVPAGELEFPIGGLERKHWSGFVVYAGNRRAAVWADVAISIPVTNLVAAMDLPADVTIEAAHLRIEKAQTADPREASILSLEEVRGLAPRSPIKAGAIIHRSDLVVPPAIRKGDAIRVEVQSGLAWLHFDAVAEAPARLGEMVELRSPVSNKIFKARLDSPSKAVVIVGAKREL
jgi:flagella basal body P-ring formation protein FlgA